MKPELEQHIIYDESAISTEGDSTMNSENNKIENLFLRIKIKQLIL